MTITDNIRPKWNDAEDYRVQRNEPVLDWIRNDLRVVRCGYGAEVLESKHCIAYDYDSGKEGFDLYPPFQKHELTDFFYFFCKKAEERFPKCDWALYATANGIRIVEVSGYGFEWDRGISFDVDNYTTLGSDTGSDRVYVELSKRMQDFRLRVSPKPHRTMGPAMIKIAKKFPILYNLCGNGYVTAAFVCSTILPEQFASEAAQYHHRRSEPHFDPHLPFA